jgi:hypothetical protein
MNVKNSTSTNTWSPSLDSPKNTKGTWEGTTRPPVQPDMQSVDPGTADTFETTTTNQPVNLTGT